MRARPSAVLAAALAAPLSLAAPAVAVAQGSEGTGFGLGVQTTLTGLAGPTLSYQTPTFHVEGILGYSDDDVVTEIQLAGRFFWEVHSTAASDLSIGGGLGIESIDFGGESDTDLHLEVGARIRAFLAANLALGATLGVGLENGDDGADDDIIFLSGTLIGGVGLTYFFF